MILNLSVTMKMNHTVNYALIVGRWGVA